MTLFLNSSICVSSSGYAYRRCDKCGMPDTLKRNELGWFIAPSCNCYKPLVLKTVITIDTTPLKENEWKSITKQENI